MLRTIQKAIHRIITNEERRIRLQMTVMSGVLFFFGLVMFVLNLVERASAMALVTGVFSALCMIAFLLLIIRNNQTAATYIVAVSTIAMFLSFIYNGGADGFSVIWICLLPIASMFFLGMKRGVAISIFMQLILILAFWTALSGLLRYPYAPSFRTRFPIVYFTSFVIALALEYIRLNTYNIMRETMSQLDGLGKIDALTQIENRRFFDQRLVELWEIVMRTSGQFSMLMIDVDCFKNYNDHYGHIAGDKALMDIAVAIRSSISRKSDVAARWGGEEFAVLLPLTDTGGALQVAERIMDAIRKKNIPHEYTTACEKRISVSIGVANLYPTAYKKPAELIKLADDGLYRAKSDGRNRICVGVEAQK